MKKQQVKQHRLTKTLLSQLGQPTDLVTTHRFKTTDNLVQYGLFEQRLNKIQGQNLSAALKSRKYKSFGPGRKFNQKNRDSKTKFSLLPRSERVGDDATKIVLTSKVPISKKSYMAKLYSFLEPRHPKQQSKRSSFSTSSLSISVYSFPVSLENPNHPTCLRQCSGIIQPLIATSSYF